MIIVVVLVVTLLFNRKRDEEYDEYWVEQAQIVLISIEIFFNHSKYLSCGRESL